MCRKSTLVEAQDLLGSDEHDMNDDPPSYLALDERSICPEAFKSPAKEIVPACASTRGLQDGHSFEQACSSGKLVMPVKRVRQPG